LRLKFAMLTLLLLFPAACGVVRSTDPYRGMSLPSEPRIERPPDATYAETPDAPLVLDQAIEIALANNPEIAAVTWEAAGAVARRETAIGEMIPDLRVVGSYNHHLDEQRLVPAAGPNEPAALSRDIVSGDLVLTVPLFSGGRLVSRYKAADLLEKASMQNLARSRQELVFNVTSVFYGILAQKSVVESLEFSRQTLQEHLQRVDLLIASRKAAKVDRLRTEVRLADIEQNLVREKNSLAIQFRILANFLGLENLDRPLPIQGDLTRSGDAALPELDRAYAVGLSNRGDYLAARSSLEAQGANVDSALAGYWPSLAVQGSYGGRWGLEPVTGSPDADTIEDIGRIGLVLDIPLLDAVRTRSLVREQRAGLSADRARLRQLEMQIRLEVETALLNIASARQRIAASGKALEQAMETLDIERRKYELGEGAAVDVLDAQAALYQTQSAHYRALADYHISLAQLKLAMGGES